MALIAIFGCCWLYRLYFAPGQVHATPGPHQAVQVQATSNAQAAQAQHSTTGQTSVNFDNDHKQWKGRITVTKDGIKKQKHVGYFKNQAAARAAVQAAASPNMD